MSIMMWRVWNIHWYSMPTYSSSQLDQRQVKLDYELLGLYGSVWVPNQVMQAHCNKNCSVGDGICMWKCTTCHQEWMQLHHRIENISCPRCTTPTGIHICSYRVDHNSDVPFPTCSCGIYGNNTHEIITKTLGCCTVLGIVEIWGKIIVAEYGYRAQYALMRALINKSWGTNHGQPSAGIVARDYQVPLLPSIEYAQKEYFS
jgi:hypothetical protein